MKKIIAIALILVAVTATEALARRVHVRGSYLKRTGTYVAPHYRTAPDHSRYNNWSARGNTNPYSGKSGTVDPYKVRMRRR